MIFIAYIYNFCFNGSFVNSISIKLYFTVQMCFHDIHHLSCLECSLEYIRKNNSVFCSEQINITNQLILLYNVKFTLDYFIYIPKVYQNFTYIIFVYRHCGISCSCRGWFLNYCRRFFIRCCAEKRGMWKKYVFLFNNYCEVESCFFLSLINFMI